MVERDCRSFRKAGIAAGISVGDHIVVTIERNTAERDVGMPDDLKAALTATALTNAWQRADL